MQEFFGHKRTFHQKQQVSGCKQTQRGGQKNTSWSVSPVPSASTQGEITFSAVGHMEHKTLFYKHTHTYHMCPQTQGLMTDLTDLCGGSGMILERDRGVWHCDGSQQPSPVPGCTLSPVGVARQWGIKKGNSLFIALSLLGSLSPAQT